MEYVALRPCNFGGQPFKTGELVPEDLLINPKNLVKLGVIAAKAETETAAISTVEPKSTITITVNTESGDLDLELNQAGLQAVVAVLTAKVADTETIINNMTDPDALILLDIVDSRKAVKQLAKDRALSIGEQQ